MRTTRTFVIGTCLMLTACSVLLPQSAAPEEVGDTPPGQEVVVVEQAVEVLPPGSASSEEGIGPTTVEIIGGDEAALREFVERWLGPTYPGQQADHVTVYLGSLPTDLPYALPLPEGTRVIGSVNQALFSYLQVILETSLSPEEVMAFYDERLLETGWQAASDASYGGGFVSGDPWLAYCLGEEAALSITASPWITGGTDVRLFIERDLRYSRCNSEYMSGQDPGTALIPTLKSPPGVQMVGGITSGSSDSMDAYTETHLLTDLSAGEVAANYNEQLEAAGWTLLESGESEGHAWSYWSLTDEEGLEWFGTLVLLEVPPGSDTIFAYIRVTR